MTRHALLLLVALALAPRARASDPAEAMVFIRVFGDVQVELTRPWKQAVGEQDVEIATGSGFVIAPSGLILTSHHVVSGETRVARIQGEEARLTTTVKRIEVVVGSGEGRQTFEPFVAAADADLDLAVLQVAVAELPYLPFGDSDAAEPGRPTKVLGFPFGRRVEVGRRPGPDVIPEVTVTAGSVSATRVDEGGETRFLQTDASVNPGSSGGPMVDEDGYAIGLVKMKIMAGRDASGPGFTVPINVVKDFLDAHGLLQQLPTARLRRGVVQGLGWKGLGIELPDGFSDVSPARLRLDTLDSGGPLSVRVDRVATPWTVASLEEALLNAAAPGFVPAPAGSVRRVERGKPSRVLGSAAGTTADGKPFRVEYAMLDLGREKVVARYLGPPDDMAFNLSLVRRSLEGLEATRLLTDEVRAPLKVAFEPVQYPGAAVGAVSLPAGWVSEPAASASCERARAAEAGLAASPPGDFTVVFRALRWPRSAIMPQELARTCGAPPGGTTYTRRSERLGVVTSTWGAVVARGEEILLLEAEAPEAKLPFVRDAFETWVRQGAAGS